MTRQRGADSPLHRAARALSIAAALVRDLVRALWRTHVRLLLEHPAYATAITAAAAALVSQTSLPELGIACLTAAVAIVTALHRGRAQN